MESYFIVPENGEQTLARLDRPGRLLVRQTRKPVSPCTVQVAILCAARQALEAVCHL